MEEEQFRCDCQDRKYFKFAPFKHLIYLGIGLAVAVAFTFLTMQLPPYLSYWYVILVGIAIGILTTSSMASFGVVALIYVLAEFFRGGFFVTNIFMLLFNLSSMILLVTVIVVYVSLGFFIGGTISMFGRWGICEAKCKYEGEK